MLFSLLSLLLVINEKCLCEISKLLRCPLSRLPPSYFERRMIKDHRFIIMQSCNLSSRPQLNRTPFFSSIFMEKIDRYIMIHVFLLGLNISTFGVTQLAIWRLFNSLTGIQEDIANGIYMMWVTFLRFLKAVRD